MMPRTGGLYSGSWPRPFTPKPVGHGSPRPGLLARALTRARTADRKNFAEVKVTGWVEEHDLQVKVKAVRRLLAKEDMVKISIYHKRGQALDKLVRRFRTYK